MKLRMVSICPVALRPDLSRHVDWNALSDSFQHTPRLQYKCWEYDPAQVRTWPQLRYDV